MLKITTPSISVIIPVYMGGAQFKRCIQSMVSTVPEPLEIIVVADGEGDGSWRCAEKLGLQVLKTPSNGGPARARNLGARAARGDILLFIDADILVPRDIFGLIAALFEENPGTVAAFGSYDDSPGEPNFLSQYKNLLHHYVHQTGNKDASTFWAGCGAVRRDAFFSLGGFNEGYRKPCIEDIELGYRLKKAGHPITLSKKIQVKHLKRWNISSLLRTDFFCRALPWTELIMKEGLFINDLNLKFSSRLSVVIVYLLIIALAGAAIEHRLVFLLPFLMAVLAGLNWDLYRFFARKRGIAFTLAAVPWHWLYFLYSGLAFIIGFLKARLFRFAPAVRAQN
jgi:glycosyltransferase involved in cell wall biosynthesis